MCKNKLSAKGRWLVQQISLLRSWLHISLLPQTNKFVCLVLGKRRGWLIFGLRIPLVIGITGIVLGVVLPDSSSSRFFAVGASLELLSVPLLADAAWEFFARPARPGRQVGAVYLEPRTAEGERAVLLGFALWPLWSLPGLRRKSAETIFRYVAPIGLLLIVIGLTFEIVGGLIG